MTPDERRTLLRAFADRMLLKVTAMDDPEDMPGVEKAVRVAAGIERVYSRCDRAERQIRDQTPNPRKLEAERASHEEEAIKARVSLANTLEWGEKRRRDLGKWWDAAEERTRERILAQPAQPQAQTSVETLPQEDLASQTVACRQPTPVVSYVDYTESILKARAALGLNTIEVETPAPDILAPEP
ncbi:hypothetical protein MMA231_01203 [Asticcacaulis sp. MM231]